MKSYVSTEDPDRLSVGLTDVIISILDKSLIEKENEELYMHYSPECYIEGYKILSLDSGLINQILKEADSFVHRILLARSIHYEHRPGEMRQMSTSETKNIVAEVLNTIVPYISDDMATASNQV